MSYPEFKGALAVALAGLGQLDEALDTVNEAVASAGQREDGQVWYLPELLRIKGEVLLQQAADRSASAAEDCFKQAGEMAREQGALFWETGTRICLASLWRPWVIRKRARLSATRSSTIDILRGSKQPICALREQR